MLTADTTPKDKRRTAVHRSRVDGIIRAFLHDNDIPADDFVSASLTARIFEYIARQERRDHRRAVAASSRTTTHG
jgi:hypothetical protein